MTTPTPLLMSIHHIKFAVSDLQRSLQFYEWLLGAKRIAQADHRKLRDGSLYAYILDAPKLGCMIELRLNLEQADKSRGFDPLTIAVKDRSALEALAIALDKNNVPHSPVITAVRGWVMVVEDPDGLRLRFYTLEKHGLELPPDEDNEWVKD